MKFGGDSKEKPKGALAALVGAPPSSLPGEEVDHGFKALAKAFGIPPEREATAKAALKSYIKACVAESSEPEVEEEY
jgi:hypothetical protein